MRTHLQAQNEFGLWHWQEKEASYNFMLKCDIKDDSNVPLSSF